jgi:hypothetical protein
MLTTLKTLVHYIGSVEFYLRYHGWAAVFWFVMILPSWFWFRDSLFWVIFISLYANLATEWGAWQAVRAERQARQATQEAALAAVKATEAAAIADERRTQTMLDAIHEQDD